MDFFKAFSQAINDSKFYDSTPLLIYCDWLEEQGREEAELLRFLYTDYDKFLTELLKLLKNGTAFDNPYLKVVFNFLEYSYNEDKKTGESSANLIFSFKNKEIECSYENDLPVSFTFVGIS